MNLKLKPCPWCGSDVSLVYEGTSYPFGKPMTHYQIRCPEHSAMSATSWPSEENADKMINDFVKNWNNTVWDEEKGIWRESDEN